MMTTHDAHTGTVETLTAEVRTLVIGNRQVTLSVLGQLDIVHPCAIEPLGRVRPRNSDGEIHTIGRIPAFISTVTGKPIGIDGPRPPGTLVRSWLLTRAEWERGDRKAPCWGSHSEIDPTVCMCHAEFYGYDPEATADGVARVEQWERLPLLVLAGLR